MKGNIVEAGGPEYVGTTEYISHNGEPQPEGVVMGYTEEARYGVGRERPRALPEGEKVDRVGYANGEGLLGGSEYHTRPKHLNRK